MHLRGRKRTSSVLELVLMVADSPHPQGNGITSAQATQPDSSTVATPAAREAAHMDVNHNTPFSDVANGQPDTLSGLQSQSSGVEHSVAANGITDTGTGSVSVKSLIQRRSSNSEVRAYQHFIGFSWLLAQQHRSVVPSLVFSYELQSSDAVCMHVRKHAGAHAA